MDIIFSIKCGRSLFGAAKAWILCFALFFVSDAHLFGQSDLCENATDISGDFGGSICSDDNGASNDPDDGDVSSCYDSDSEVWYSFTGYTSVQVGITSWCGSSYEPTVTIYEGSCGGGLSELACRDYVAGDSVTQAAGLDATKTYYISIDNNQLDCSGNFCFDLGEVSTGDCIGSSKNINECGTAFTLNNGGLEGCYSNYCGNDDVACGTKNNGDILNSNYDGDCTTECGPCPDGSGGGFNGDGCDMDGSTENNAFWSFVPPENCGYDVSFDIYNCDNGDGMQYAIYQYDGGTITNYYAHDGGGNTGTITESFTASTTGEVVIMVDGLGGDVCDVDVSVSPQADCSGCLLPVELLEFEGEASKSGNKILWRTASEDESSHFIVERSKTGKEFKSIERVKAAGSSVQTRSYDAFDPEPYPGITFYRLRTVDKNGKSEVSKVISVRTKKDESFTVDKVYANSASNALQFDLHSAQKGGVRIELHDRTGRKVSEFSRSVEEGRNTLRKDLSGLAEGFYILRIQQGEKSVSESFILR